MTLGAPFAARPFPSASSALRRGFVHLVKPSARVLAVWGLRRETLSRSPIEPPGGLKIALHSDWSGNGGIAVRGISFESEAEGVEGIEVEYEKRPEVVWGSRTLRVETSVELRHERGACLSDGLERRVLWSIICLTALEAGRWQSVRRNGAEARMMD